MSSIREQILARMLVVLTGTLPGAIPVWRSAEFSFDRTLVPAVVIKPDDEETIPLTDLLEVSHLKVHLEVIVRGNVWDNLADPIIVAGHALLLNDATLATLCSRIRRTEAKWAAHEADSSAGVLTQGYRLQYSTQTNSL